MPSISEFADELWQNILKKLYDPLYESVSNSYGDMFSVLNYEVAKATERITSGPQSWNGNAFGLMRNIAETICIPIAAAFITVILCWELIHLVQESNNMNNVKPDRIILVLMKFALCLLVCAKSFDIVIAFFELGSWASGKLGALTSFEVRHFDAQFNNILPETPPVYELKMLFTLIGYKIILIIGKLGILICGAIVYIRVMIWFLEILLYSAAAAIPYSTWVNKEWAQVGMNYTRKMIALAFEGFFMLLLFSIYSGVIAGISQGGDFMQNMVMIIGCGFALAIMMFKTGSISASIFNAH